MLAALASSPATKALDPDPFPRHSLRHAVFAALLHFGFETAKFQKDSALAKWFDLRTADGRGSTRKTMIVALARKLLIALWRLVKTGEVPEGVALRPAA